MLLIAITILIVLIATAIVFTYTQLSLRNKERIQTITSITALVSALEDRDDYTRFHSKNVSIYAKELGKKLKLPAKQLDDLWLGGLIHDIGKINIPNEILNKPDKLTDEEMEIIKHHPAKGAEIISSVPVLSHLIPIVRHHHEKLDGSGYPNGLKNNGIPYIAKIIAVADVFDALSTDRSYRRRMPKEEIIDELKQMAGHHLDPKIVTTLIENFDEIAGKGITI